MFHADAVGALPSENNLPTLDYVLTMSIKIVI